MKNLFTVLFPVVFLCACTYSVTMTHSDRSQGSTDTVEEAQTSNPNIAPNVNVPLTPKP